METVYRMEALKKEATQERQRREMLQAANERLALVTRIGKSLAASLRPREIMTRLWEGLLPAVDMHTLGLGRLDPDLRMIEFSSWIEDGKSIEPRSISLDDESSFTARCIREAADIYFPTSAAWNAALDGKKPIRIGEYTTAETILFLPLSRDGRVIGCMSLQSWQPDAYTSEVIEMLTAISAFVSIAVENSVILSKLDTINRMVKSEKEAIEKIALLNSWQAEHDLLTGLPNRVLLDKILDGLSSSHTEEDLIGIIYLDLDGFKDINDLFGHDAGDRALIQVTERLKSVLRSVDHIARIGGDEFVVVIPGIKFRRNVPRILENLTESLVLPLRLNEGDVEMRFSAGVALFPTDGEEFKDLIRYADEAMYRVKRGSKNGWSFWSDPIRNGS
jgi:diguanylate cyclase (GGDEF)-like protein